MVNLYENDSEFDKELAKNLTSRAPLVVGREDFETAHDFAAGVDEILSLNKTMALTSYDVVKWIVVY